jgi:nucleoside-diphosphate-sugar epimerase
MKSRSVLIIGYGDLGLRVSERLLPLGAKVGAVCRSANKLPAGITQHIADYTTEGSLAFCEGLGPDYVLATFTPSERSEQGYIQGFDLAMDNLLAGLGAHRPKCILMASSTRVFAESGGGWVDEHSELSKSDPNARAIIAAERKLLDSLHNASVVRFAGIYGYASGRLMERIQRGDVSPAEPVLYTNRIHREDCAGFLSHLIAMVERGEQLDPTYIGVDDCPAPRHEVESWLAAQLGVTPGAPPKNERKEPGAHKRCRNRGLKASGYKLEFADYRVGYGAIIEALEDKNT